MHSFTSDEFNEIPPKPDAQTWFTNLAADFLGRPNGILTKAHDNLIERIIDCIITSDPEELVKSDNLLDNVMQRKIVIDSRESFSEGEWEVLKLNIPKLLKPFLLDEIKEARARDYIMGETHHVCIQNTSGLLKDESNKKNVNPISVVYDEQRVWGKPVYDNTLGIMVHSNDWRPYEEIVIIGPIGNVRIWCLVDTGADKLQVDSAFAQVIGLNLQAQGKTNTVKTAGGGTIQVSEITLGVQIEAKQKQTDCLFAANSMPLLGRDTILNFLEIGFDQKGWLLKE